MNHKNPNNFYVTKLNSERHNSEKKKINLSEADHINLSGKANNLEDAIKFLESLDN